METHAIALHKLVLKSCTLPRYRKKTMNTWPLYFLENTAYTEGSNRLCSLTRAQLAKEDIDTDEKLVFKVVSCALNIHEHATYETFR